MNYFGTFGLRSTYGLQIILFLGSPLGIPLAVLSHVVFNDLRLGRLLSVFTIFLANMYLRRYKITFQHSEDCLVKHYSRPENTGLLQSCLSFYLTNICTVFQGPSRHATSAGLEIRVPSQQLTSIQLLGERSEPQTWPLGMPR